MYVLPLYRENVIPPQIITKQGNKLFLDALIFSQIVENHLVIRPNDKLFIKTRRDHINLCNWIFIRNLNPDAQKVGAFDFNFELQPYDMKIIPYNLVLKGCKIDLSSLSIFGKIATEDKEAVILILEEDNSIKISDYDTFSLDEKLSYKEEVNSVILNFNDIEDLDFAKASFTRFGKETEFIFLKKQTAAKTWILDNKFIFGADFIWPNKNELAVSQSATIKTYDLETYSERRIDFDEKKPHFEVTRFRSAYCAKEIDIPFVEASWPVCDGGTDSFTNKIYNEFIWYKTTFDGTVDTFYICAKHCFALYLNGQQIFEHNSYCYEHLYEREECVTIMPDKSFFKEKNELTILIQNLGFDKGFSNDTNLPRGLLSFGSLPERDFVWKIKGALLQKMKIGLI